MNHAQSLSPAKPVANLDSHYYHPAVLSELIDFSQLSADQIQAIEKRVLQRFLIFTEELELNIINRSFKFILGSNSKYGTQSREEAKLIKRFVTEEEVHAELAQALCGEIFAEPPVAFKTCGPDYLLGELRSKYASSGLEIAEIDFFFAFASETLISKRLSLNSRPEIKRSVREYMRMHMLEEILHREYFMKKFAGVYEGFSREKRQLVMAVVADAIKLFLSNNPLSLKFDICALGLEPDLVLTETSRPAYPDAFSTITALGPIVTGSDFKFLNAQLKGSLNV